MGREKYFSSANIKDLDWWRNLAYSPSTVTGFCQQADKAVGLIKNYFPENPFVLVVGYGFGRDTNILKREIPQAKVVALDINQSVLKDNISGNAEFFRANAEQIPLRSECMDAVLCLETLIHVDDCAISLKEMFRVIRPGGILVFNIGAADRPVMWNLLKGLLRTEGIKRTLGKLVPRKRGPIFRTKYISLLEVNEMVNNLVKEDRGLVVESQRYLAGTSVLVAIKKLT